MNGRVLKVTVLALGMAIGGTTGAWAQGIPVYDNATFLQQVTAVKHAFDSLTQMKQQLSTMQQHVNMIKGGRGMETLLGNQVRDYLPKEWADIQKVGSQGYSQYSDIARSIQTIAGKNAVLSADDLQRMTPQVRELILRARNSAATQAAMSQAAYNRASQNVGQLQQLTDAISTASDPKAIQDLQARIQTEQAMLQNDAIKLAQLTQSQQADDQAVQVMLRERAIAMGGTSLEASTIKIRCPVPNSSKCGPQ